MEKSQILRNTEVPLKVEKVFKYEAKRKEDSGKDTYVDSKIGSQAYWWIDTQKRILIKTSAGRILVFEI